LSYYFQVIDNSCVCISTNSRNLQFIKNHTMRLKLYTAAAFISFIVLSSCSGNKDKDYTDKSLVSPATGNETIQAVAPDTTITQTSNTLPAATTTVPGTNPVNIAPQNKSVNFLPANTQPANVATQTAPVTINQQQATTTAPGMNPPHGQPNHRCDIAVGAPLNSPPAAKQTVVPATIAAPKTDSTKN
jgi:hypothetical protein